jgi:hypothetical protein
MFAAVAAASLAAMAVPASAQTAPQTSFYGNLGYSYVDGGEGAQFNAVDARLGVRYGQYLGAEAEGVIGVDHDNFAGVESKLKRSFAGYAVGFLPITPQFDLLARVGYGSSRIGFKENGGSTSLTAEGVAFGGGGQYSFDANNALRAEYTRYDLNHNLSTADVWSVNYVRKF